VKVVFLFCFVCCSEGTYVRVIGTVRSFQDTLHVVSHDVRAVEDHNQITHHFLEAIFQHCQRTKPAPAPAAPNSWGQAGAPPRSNQLGGSMALENQSGGGAPNAFNSVQNEVHF
jgi:replication factor A2